MFTVGSMFLDVSKILYVKIKIMYRSITSHKIRARFIRSKSLKRLTLKRSTRSSGTSTSTTAEQLRLLLSKGGFRLTEWQSNSRKVIKRLPTSEKSFQRNCITFLTLLNVVTAWFHTCI